MEVLAHTVNEEFPAGFLGWNETLTLHCSEHGLNNLVNTIAIEQIGDFSGGKQIIDENHELLLGNLSFGEEEAKTLILASCTRVIVLEVSLQVIHAVS